MPNNGRVINCPESARKLEVMDVVRRARQMPRPPSIIARDARVADPERLSRGGERLARQQNRVEK